MRSIRFKQNSARVGFDRSCVATICCVPKRVHGVSTLKPLFKMSFSCNSRAYFLTWKRQVVSKLLLQIHVTVMCSFFSFPSFPLISVKVKQNDCRWVLVHVIGVSKTVRTHFDVKRLRLWRQKLVIMTSKVCVFVVWSLRLRCQTLVIVTSKLWLWHQKLAILLSEACECDVKSLWLWRHKFDYNIIHCTDAER